MQKDVELLSETEPGPDHCKMEFDYMFERKNEGQRKKSKMCFCLFAIILQ